MTGVVVTSSGGVGDGMERVALEGSVAVVVTDTLSDDDGVSDAAVRLVVGEALTSLLLLAADIDADDVNELLSSPVGDARVVDAVCVVDGTSTEAEDTVADGAVREALSDLVVLMAWAIRQQYAATALPPQEKEEGDAERQTPRSTETRGMQPTSVVPLP